MFALPVILNPQVKGRSNSLAFLKLSFVVLVRSTPRSTYPNARVWEMLLGFADVLWTLSERHYPDRLYRGGLHFPKT